MPYYITAAAAPGKALTLELHIRDGAGTVLNHQTGALVDVATADPATDAFHLDMIEIAGVDTLGGYYRVDVENVSLVNLKAGDWIEAVIREKPSAGSANSFSYPLHNNAPLLVSNDRLQYNNGQTPVDCDDVLEDMTWRFSETGDGVEADNIIVLPSTASAKLAMEFGDDHRVVDVAIGNPQDVYGGTITFDAPRVTENRRQVMFNVSGLSVTAKYLIRVDVRMTNGDLLSRYGHLQTT